MIRTQMTETRISSNSAEAFSLYEKSVFGEKKEGKIETFSGKKKIDKETIIKKLKKFDKKMYTKFIAYKDLRKKGYILKTALKYGADFRVYERGIRPGEEHARWILFVVRETEALNWHDFAAKNRIAHSTKKNLLIAIIDEEDDVSYYEVSWRKP